MHSCFSALVVSKESFAFLAGFDEKHLEIWGQFELAVVKDHDNVICPQFGNTQAINMIARGEHCECRVYTNACFWLLPGVHRRAQAFGLQNILRL